MRDQQLQDLGPYRVVRRIATGGMAEIYLARQRGLEGIERTVVVKRILERYAHDAEFVTMFLDEARLMAALSHPNIAQVFDVGKVGASTYYLVMEHVRGPTLGALLKAARASGAPGLPRREALGIGLLVAEALDYVHDRRDELGRPLDIVHRDLNPANVIVSYEGGVKLIDFGIAKAATKVYETRTGVIKGTYGYIAPEQLVGAAVVDRRADVFALGILLYEMCVGEHPFDASDEPDLVNRILEARYRRPKQVRPDVPPDLDRLIASCLAPHPEGRPETVGAVIEALAAHLGEQGMVPTQRAIAALAKALVPDDEGPRPLHRPSAVRRGRRPFAEEPGTHKVQPAPKTPEPDASAVPAHADPLPDEPARDDGAPDTQGQEGEHREDGAREETARDDRPRDGQTRAGEPLEGEARDAVDRRDAGGASRGSAEDGLGERSDPPSGAAIQGRRGEPPVGLIAEAVRRPAHPTPTTARRLLPADARGPGAEPPTRTAGWTVPALGVAGLLGAGLIAFVAGRALGGDGSPASRTPLPDEAPARRRQELRIVSEPAGARVQIDGRLAEGVTPLVMALPSGAQEVSLRLSKPGYRDQEREVSAAAGEARFILRPAAR